MTGPIETLKNHRDALEKATESKEAVQIGTLQSVLAGRRHFQIERNVIAPLKVTNLLEAINETLTVYKKGVQACKKNMAPAPRLSETVGVHKDCFTEKRCQGIKAKTVTLGFACSRPFF